MTDHPWIKSCPAGVTWDTPLPLAPVQSLLDDTVARWPDNPALDFMGRVIDYLVTLDMAALYPRMARLLGDSRLKKLIVGNLGDDSAQPAAVRAQLQGAGHSSPVPADDRHLSFEQLLANDGACPQHALGDLRQAIVVLQYTGGTTGLPKGAMLTHANLSAACAQFFASIQGDPPTLKEGAERMLVDLDATIHDLSAKMITMFSGVPTMYTAFGNHRKVKDGALRSLQFCGSGGAPLPGIELKFESLTGPGTDAASGEPGELCIRGPNVMMGYWKAEAATAKSMTPDGFFRSGDLATMDTDRFVFIEDRTKDRLRCGGCNVYPRVIEEAIYEHPAVEAVCVIGIPDDCRGQSPKAVLKLKDLGDEEAARCAATA